MDSFGTPMWNCRTFCGTFCEPGYGPNTYLYLFLRPGMIMSAMWGLSGKESMIEGMDSVGCTAARVLNYSLNGNQR